MEGCFAAFNRASFSPGDLVKSSFGGLLKQHLTGQASPEKNCQPFGHFNLELISTPHKLRTVTHNIERVANGFLCFSSRNDDILIFCGACLLDQ
jgi:hypothetical protein